jgi:hypothetical protein
MGLELEFSDRYPSVMLFLVAPQNGLAEVKRHKIVGANVICHPIEREKV